MAQAVGPAAATARLPPALMLARVLALMVASGFAGLGCQIVWTQQGALWLGHESAAVLAVVTAFFGGLSLGALALGRRIEASARPARWYAVCETVIAVWSMVLALTMAPASERLLALTGAQPSAAWQWGVAFCGTLLLLLPATAAMGATLPAMARVTAGLAWPQGGVAALYAANTFGAMTGVLACAFWLVPTLGLMTTAALCALLNASCALVAWRLPGIPPPVTAAAASTGPRSRHLLPLLAATGLLGIAYEVLVVRVLSQVTENTVYTFAMLLAVYLVGTAAGAALYQRSQASTMDAQTVRRRLLLALAAACLLSSAGLWGAQTLHGLARQVAGAGMAGALACEAALALAAFVLPTVLMGALFSHLAAEARQAGIGFSRALGVNTLAAALAPLLFGVVLLPAVGAKLALLSVPLAYLLLAYPLRARRAWFWRGAIGAMAVALALLAPPLAFIDVPEGGRLISYTEGAMAAVSVVEDAQGVASLHIDNRQQEGSSATLLSDARQALLPLLLHPAPGKALFLGMGTGVTSMSAARDPGLQVDVVELLPEVIKASAHFTPAAAGGPPNPRLRVLAADARRYVRASNTQYDLIVSDNFHPARSGSGSLYTVEHFRAVQARLAAGGLFCQWLPLHQLDLPTLRSIVQAFVAVYPEGTALLATYSLETPVLGLVARAGPSRFELHSVRQRLAAAAAPLQLDDFGLGDEFALLGSFVAGPRALARFAGKAPLNTDDHPVVAYAAPRITYAPDSLPRERLLVLLAELASGPTEPAELINSAAETTWPPRLAAYWAARNRYLAAGRDVRAAADVRQMLAQVREPLLSALRISPDFSPAYDPLLRMAVALADSDPPAARALLQDLLQVQPGRPEAAQALRQLAAAAP